MSARVAGAGDGLVEVIRARVDKGKELVSRDAMQDGRLSMKARGILAYLVSKPDRWRTSAAAIAGTCDKDGREAIANGLSELETLGYLVRRRKHGSDGRWGWFWVYSDSPEEVLQVLSAMGDDGTPDARRGRVRASSQVKPINGKPVSGEEKPQVDSINGFAAHGETADGKPGDIESEDVERPPLPPAGRGESDLPAGEEPPAPPARCEAHNIARCRECGLSPRVQARAQRDADELAEKVRLDEIRACSMCDGEGRRWVISSECDHRTSPEAARAEADAAARRAAEEADAVRQAAEEARAVERPVGNDAYLAARAALASKPRKFTAPPKAGRRPLSRRRGVPPAGPADLPEPRAGEEPQEAVQEPASQGVS